MDQLRKENLLEVDLRNKNQFFADWPMDYGLTIRNGYQNYFFVVLLSWQKVAMSSWDFLRGCVTPHTQIFALVI
jgi:hypothetical protein